MTMRKFESQLEQVERAFAWIRMRRFVISAGYSHVMPSQPYDIVSMFHGGEKELDRLLTNGEECIESEEEDSGDDAVARVQHRSVELVDRGG